MAPEIFIQIAAYRDPETLPTILDAIEKAEKPDRLTVGLCWQFQPGVDEKMLPAGSLPECVRILSVDARESRGVCWARSVVQALYQGEAYTLSIDSHMRFEKDWDTLLVEELEGCPSANPVLTTYPARYLPETGIDVDVQTTVMVIGETIDGFPRFRTVNVLPSPNRPLRGLFVAGGFYFSRGRIVEDVPYDPNLYFNQEEFALALRLWTYGYDVYSPTRSFVYHLYYADQDQRALHTDDNAKWAALDKVGNLRLQHLAGLHANSDSDVIRDVQHYSLGFIRSRESFYELAGIKPGELPSADSLTGEFLYRLNPDRQFSLRGEA